MVDIFFRSPDLVLAAALFSASPGSDRDSLIGVRIEVRDLPEDNDTPYDQEVFIVGTDGSMLFVGHHLVEAFGDPTCFTLPLEAVRSLKSGRFTGIRYDSESDQVRIQSGAMTTLLDTPEGRYPDWRRVIPSAYKVKAAMYDPALLVRVDRARRALGVKSPVAITPCGEGPGHIDFHRPDCFGQIMPLRYPYTDSPPSWVR